MLKSQSPISVGGGGGGGKVGNQLPKVNFKFSGGVGGRLVTNFQKSTSNF